MNLSREFSLEAKTVEKDYVLGWLLAGIASHSLLFEKWIFKGGTCLKKCYFETYRFSEDLDYTLLDKNQVDEKFLVESFSQIADWIYDAVGIEIPKDTIKFEIYENSFGRQAIEGKIGYVGPLQQRSSLARIKLDLTTEEILVKPPDLREVHHPYTDKPTNGMVANCYSFAEVFAEKIRALSERARPRDLYDVIHLYRHIYQNANPNLVSEILAKKCAYKFIPVPTMTQIENHPNLHELKAEWKSMLAHQLPTLPPFEPFWEELPNVFDWLHGIFSKPKLESTPKSKEEENIDRSWRPPSMIRPWHTTAPLELARYAGANHLCVRIEYQKEDRQIEKYLIEPYDLKRTKNGKILLMALKHSTNEWRSFRFDRIKRMEVTQMPFKPRFIIGLTPFLP